MSKIAAGTTTGQAIVTTGDTTGNLVLTVNNTTDALTLNTSGALGVGATPSYGTSGQVLTSAGNGAAPAWATPTVSVPGGSTGQLQYNNSGVFGAISSGTSGQVLVSAGAGAAPTWGSPDTVGTFKTVAPGVNPGSGYILANGATVLQSAYPQLYAVTGLQSLGATGDYANYGLGSASFPPRAAASNRTDLVMVIKSDGSVWTGNRTSGFTEVGNAGLGGVVTSLNHFGGTWVATSATSPFLRYSTNAGVTWTTPATPPTNALHRAVYANGRWIALSNTSSSWSATSIGSWSTISGIANAYDCAYGAGVWVIVRNSGQAYYSSDFTTWNTITVGGSVGNNIIWTGNLFLATYDSVFFTSTNGINFGRGASSGGTVPVNSLALMEGGQVYYVAAAASYGLTSNGTSVTGAIGSPGGLQNSYPVYLDGYIYAAFSTNEFLSSFPMYSYNRSTQFLVPVAPGVATQYPPANSLTYVKAS